jgi:hypothetical protein
MTPHETIGRGQPPDRRDCKLVFLDLAGRDQSTHAQVAAAWIELATCVTFSLY